MATRFLHIEICEVGTSNASICMVYMSVFRVTRIINCHPLIKERADSWRERSAKEPTDSKALQPASPGIVMHGLLIEAWVCLVQDFCGEAPSSEATV